MHNVGPDQKPPGTLVPAQLTTHHNRFTPLFVPAAYKPLGRTLPSSQAPQLLVHWRQGDGLCRAPAAGPAAAGAGPEGAPHAAGDALEHEGHEALGAVPEVLQCTLWRQAWAPSCTACMQGVLNWFIVGRSAETLSSVAWAWHASQLQAVQLPSRLAQPVCCVAPCARQLLWKHSLQQC
jgi:hypothetical protein